jgi:hypothetical protein
VKAFFPSSMMMTLTFATNAQTKFFIGSDGDYAILVDKGVTPKTLKPETGGYVDYYILRQNNQFTFLLSIRKVGSVSDPSFIYEEGFKKSLFK